MSSSRLSWFSCCYWLQPYRPQPKFAVSINKIRFLFLILLSQRNRRGSIDFMKRREKSLQDNACPLVDVEFGYVWVKVYKESGYWKRTDVSIFLQPSVDFNPKLRQVQTITARIIRLRGILTNRSPSCPNLCIVWSNLCFSVTLSLFHHWWCLDL